MNTRKRQASETLLPLRSAKQPRTTRHHPKGGNSTPSQADGILAGWVNIGKEAWGLSQRTFLHLAGKVSLPLSWSFNRNTSPPPRPRAPSPHPHSILPTRPPIPNQFQRTMAPFSESPRSVSSPNPITQAQTDTGNSSVVLMSPPPVPVVPSSLTTLYPQLDAALAASTLRRDSSFSEDKPRKYQNREHIFARNHKAQVKADRKKDRLEMEKELYELRRSSGYKSDFNTFRDFLNYRSRLELLERREALAPSPSLTDLRSRGLSPTSNRRHSFSQGANVDFLQRALEKARETIDGWKPPQPFSPTFDQLCISRRAKDEAIERRLRGPPPLPSHLPPEDEAQVDAFMAKKGVVSKFNREQVVDRDISRLRPSQWLNDEIINFYGALVMARPEGCKENPGVNGVTSKGGRKKPLKVHYFNTFFWSKLKGEGYEVGRLAKWTKKFDIFQKDVILIPVNHNNSHWTGAAINFRRKRIESYDSMGMDRSSVYKHLRVYLDMEHRNKKKKPFDFSEWEDYTHPDTPQQENGFDCGVFTCQFLETLSRGEESFRFTQRDMPYLRRRMVWEIGNAKLLEEP